MANFLYARLRPHNPRLGHNVKRYVIGNNLYVGQDQMTGHSLWYKVKREVGEALSHLTQGDPDLDIKLFEVVEEDEYLEIMEEVRERALIEMGYATRRAQAEKKVSERMEHLVRNKRSKAVPDVLLDDLSPVEEMSAPMPEADSPDVSALLTMDHDADELALDGDTAVPDAPRRGRRKKAR